MKRMLSAAIVIVAASAAVGAQSGKATDTSVMGDTITVTYTGCVEAVNHGASYVLTHLTEDHQTGMGHDGKMKKDSGMAMKDGSPSSDMQHGDEMMASSLLLAGASDLKKHVGQKVTVTGSVSKRSMGGGMKNEMNTLTVRSLKAAGRCE
jgi:hypothetical protein